MNLGRRALTLAVLLSLSTFVGSLAGVPVVGNVSAQVITEQILGPPQDCEGGVYGSPVLPGVSNGGFCIPEEEGSGDGTPGPTDCTYDAFNYEECNAFLADPVGDVLPVGDGFFADFDLMPPALVPGEGGSLTVAGTFFSNSGGDFAPEAAGSGVVFLELDCGGFDDEGVPTAAACAALGFGEETRQSAPATIAEDGTFTATFTSEQIAAVRGGFTGAAPVHVFARHGSWPAEAHSHHNLASDVIAAVSPTAAMAAADLLEDSSFTPVPLLLGAGAPPVSPIDLEAITIDVDLSDDSIEEQHGETAVLIVIGEPLPEALLGLLSFTSPAPADLSAIHIKLGPDRNDPRYHLHGDLDDDGDLDLTELLTCFSNPLNADSTCADPDGDEGSPEDQPGFRDGDVAGDPNGDERAPYEAPDDDDADDDGVLDDDDDCPQGDTGWTSTSETDYDGDGCRDAGEDTDDDNDGVEDGNDLCDPDASGPAGDFGADQSDKDWTSTTSNGPLYFGPTGPVLGPIDPLFAERTDHDGDGCRDAGEDTDDDNDTKADGDDSCRRGDLVWTSDESTDHDNDGCRDAGEDDDDDNDGIDDGDDSCPRGNLGWTSNGETDHDEDGCQDERDGDDTNEDTDDDNDGYNDDVDSCPRGATGEADTEWNPGSPEQIVLGTNNPDTDGDGCRAEEDQDGGEDPRPDDLEGVPVPPLPDPEQVLTNPDCSIVTFVVNNGDEDCGELGDPTVVVDALLETADETLSLVDSQDPHDADGDGVCDESNGQVDLVETFVVATTLTVAAEAEEGAPCEADSVFDPFRGGETVVVFAPGFGSPTPAAIISVGDATATPDQNEVLIVEFHPVAGPLTVCIVETAQGGDLLGPFEGTFADTGCQEPEAEPPGDDDGDEVNNDADKCPNTPQGSEVDDEGCPDSDNDGVHDQNDQCADTPDETEVDETGCPPSDEGDPDPLQMLCDGFSEATGQTLPICGEELPLPAELIDEDDNGEPEGVWIDLNGDGDRAEDESEDFLFEDAPVAWLAALIGAVCDAEPVDLPVCAEGFDLPALIIGAICMTPAAAALGDDCPEPEPCDPEDPTCEPGGIPNPCDPATNPLGCSVPGGLIVIEPGEPCTYNPDYLVEVCEGDGPVGLFRLLILGEEMLAL